VWTALVHVMDGGREVSIRDINRRLGLTRFFVPDPAFGWYMRTVTLGTVAASLTFAGLLWWYHGRLLDMLGLYDVLADPSVHHLVVQYSKLSLVVITLGALGSAFFVLITSLYLLHRISGPIYRMKLHMMEMMEGQAPRPLRFRTDDQLADLADIFNDFMRYHGLLEKGPSSAVAASQPARSAPADSTPEPV
jgi:hypothetical protein